MVEMAPVPAPEEVRFDVSGAVGAGDEALFVSATLHRPAGDPVAVLVCWPGGSYDRRYWQFDAVPGYNWAEYLAERGFAVLAADHIGTGASSKPSDVDAVDVAFMAGAAAEVARQLRAQFTDVPLVGVGHSLGGVITIVAQAEHDCYDRVASLGFTCGAKDSVAETVDGSGRAAAVEQAKAFFADWDAGYATAPRAPNHAWLYTPSTPAEVIAADDATLTAWPRQSYVDGLLAGYGGPFAAKIGCPVFLGFGEHDIPERPHDDAGFYAGSRDVTLFVLEDAAHCHNFAVTRTALWDRVGGWAADAHAR
jgi:pimeloyl-ACP methyl ester carboxylesterase